MDPQFWQESECTARKAHQCVECGHRVQPGERYVRMSGKWKDGWNAYASCVDCRDLFHEVVADYDHVDGLPAFGELWEHAHEWWRCWDPVDAADCARKFGWGRKLVDMKRKMDRHQSPKNDESELTEMAKRAIAEGRADHAAGRTFTLDEVKQAVPDARLGS